MWSNVYHTVKVGISCFCLQQGKIYYFLIEDWANVYEFNHNASFANNQTGVIGIRMLFPDPSATRLAYIDDKGDGYIFNPVRSHCTHDIHRLVFTRW